MENNSFNSVYIKHMYMYAWKKRLSDPSAYILHTSSCTVEKNNSLLLSRRLLNEFDW